MTQRVENGLAVVLDALVVAQIEPRLPGRRPGLEHDVVLVGIALVPLVGIPDRQPGEFQDLGRPAILRDDPQTQHHHPAVGRVGRREDGLLEDKPGLGDFLRQQGKRVMLESQLTAVESKRLELATVDNHKAVAGRMQFPGGGGAFNLQLQVRPGRDDLVVGRLVQKNTFRARPHIEMRHGGQRRAFAVRGRVFAAPARTCHRDHQQSGGQGLATHRTVPSAENPGWLAATGPKRPMVHRIHKRPPAPIWEPAVR